MRETPPAGSASSSGDPGRGGRLDSWKEIAAYLGRDVTTVQRWEKREGMPVHRHRHEKVGSVYAFRSDLDAWARSRTERTNGVPEGRGRRSWWILAVAAALLATGIAARFVRRGAPTPVNLLEAARFVQLTDFEGIEQAAAISRDGRFAAFLSDRDGRMDVWVTQVGTGEFVNLTRGSAPELVNPSVRTLGFSPDGNLVTFWARGTGAGAGPEIGIWAAPLLGGPPRPYLAGAAELDWSKDSTRLVFHTPGPGDPMFVRDAGADPRQIFSAPAGLHAHFPIWSPDQRFIYFVQGALPDHLDLWRIGPTGGAPERLTTHDARVSHPVLLDARTVLYLATDPDGSGPRIHALDLRTRASRRLGFGTDAWTSLAASGDGRRIVATRAIPKRSLWRVPLTGTSADVAQARRVPVSTGSASSPRFGPGWLLFVSSRGTRESIWKLHGETATELWSAPDARVIGAPAVRRDGQRIAFTIREGDRTSLLVMDADGSGVRVITSAFDLRGAPCWAPDGKAITVGVVVEGVPRLWNVPVDGGTPTTLVPEHSVDPAWSPTGDVVVFSGPDIGTTFRLGASNPDGSAHAIPDLTLTRGARHVAFLPDGRTLLVLRGEIRHKDLWAVELASGAARRLTGVAPDFEVGDFDVSPDGRELVFERLQEQADLVLIELPQR